ncbi:uncharacterized protein F5Z01DRAFT_699671 [Emericellopsis atlantica]|uniref:Malate dehydrogenase n=1 Tax=Emericellopsis atlantica TaxID=2614577 RepID=A0A9P7ZQ81_9HYPO|nr:uncharacterized protein F5Z01DRAFT_699671 [Emericellopsis atlantica]KAG9255831.1 hypothetical protein F5Z01DRAFT_699671 [Emericellopsis atlantica]
MLCKTFYILATAALAVATPVKRQSGSSCSASRPRPTLPFNGEHELESPGKDLRVKHIALGFGIQNYTCNEDLTSKATGALAMFYDITPLYPGQSDQSLTIDAFDALPSTTLYSQDIPLNFAQPNATIEGVVEAGSPFPGTDDLVVDGLSIPFSGHHLFTAAGVPHFEVGNGEIDFFAYKIDNIKAPASADAGVDGTGAVDWLYLGAVEGSVGATLVYRVLTVGGAAHKCTGAEEGDISTGYTAQYWFFG